MNTEIKVICGDCGRHIRTINGHGIEGISHGLCAKHYAERMSQVRVEDLDIEMDRELWEAVNSTLTLECV